MGDMEFIAQSAQQLQQSNQDDDHDKASGNKRKAADDGGQRARRNRYVSIACNECKRRKIRCNGEIPCQRCGNLQLDCQYQTTGFKESPEYREMAAQIAALHEQVNALWENLNQMRAQVGEAQQSQPASIDPSLQYSGHYPGVHTAPSASRPKSHSHNQQAFHASTDPSTGHLNGTGNGRSSASITDESLVQMMAERNLPLLRTMHTDKDPIWSISQAEALRLCQVYADEVGTMYPVVDISKVTAYTLKLYRFIDAARRAGLMQQGFPGADSIDDENTNILKLVLAIALTVDAAESSELGSRLFECVQPAVDKVLRGSVSINGIRLLAMTAVYELHHSNEAASWRIIGLTARLCIEFGLHRRETYEAITGGCERNETILLFWAIYVLDRRWSFGFHMPFALQELDFAPLPRPDDLSPYLSAMIQHSAIRQVIENVSSSSPDSTLINIDEMAYLDCQAVQWNRDIPGSIGFSEHPSQLSRDPVLAVSPSSRANHRLRILLYLRANQLRIATRRPVLRSSSLFTQYLEQAQHAVDCAKDTVRVLTHVKQNSDLYRTHHVLFDGFVAPALAVLFLAANAAPAVLVEGVRNEFSQALELVAEFTPGSWVSTRLAKTVGALKEARLQLAVVARNGDAGQAPARPLSGDLDGDRSAAVAMAGLAGHSVDEMGLYGGDATRWLGLEDHGKDPEGMVRDLRSLFEAAGERSHGQYGNHLNAAGEQVLWDILGELL